MEDRPSELFLANLHLLPEWQGRGIGSAVVRALIREAFEQGKHAVTLSVLHSNAAAKRLYERFGFRTIEEDKFQCLMSLSLSPG